ncbi:MAG: urease accessory protein UreF [Nitrosomonadaceae bacterium]|nr:urease accessory protein UreF [Nitrosomonadaceae bacterium]|tara:strand:+ start:924 stop:1613 length:690 start_codon:yes stop_codon:yes gene_type:complete
MKNNFIGSLLHLSDPTLPIGGFSHSHGLETYVQLNIVHDIATAESFIIENLKSNIKYNDASFVRLAYEAAASNDLNEIILLDQECTALKSAKEIRLASQKLGIRLIKIFKRYKEYKLIERYEAAIAKNQASGHYCVSFGIYGFLLGIPIEETLYAYYYNTAIGLVTNSVKLVPLGQLDGQDIMFRLQNLLEKLVSETLIIDKSLVGMLDTGLDIRCMQHEKLYSRLYMS